MAGNFEGQFLRAGSWCADDVITDSFGQHLWYPLSNITLTFQPSSPQDIDRFSAPPARAPLASRGPACSGAPARCQAGSATTSLGVSHNSLIGCGCTPTSRPAVQQTVDTSIRCERVLSKVDCYLRARPACLCAVCPRVLCVLCTPGEPQARV